MPQQPGDWSPAELHRVHAAPAASPVPSALVSRPLLPPGRLSASAALIISQAAKAAAPERHAQARAHCSPTKGHRREDDDARQVNCDEKERIEEEEDWREGPPEAAECAVQRPAAAVREQAALRVDLPLLHAAASGHPAGLVRVVPAQAAEEANVELRCPACVCGHARGSRGV